MFMIYVITLVQVERTKQNPRMSHYVMQAERAKQNVNQMFENKE